MTADMKRRGLGRGLDALFRESKSEEEAFAKPAPATAPTPVSAPVKTAAASAAAPAAATPAAVMRADEMVEASRRLMQQQARPVAGSVETKSAPGLPPASGDPVRKVGIEKLVPGKYQPRRLFNEEELDQLADSIRQHGVLQPLIVRPLAGQEGIFEIIGGERRWRAAQKAQVHEVPVVVRALSDKDALEIGLIENLQREDLTPIEEAEGYQRLIEEFRHSHDTLAYQLGRSRSHVANLLRLLRLPAPVKEMIQSGVLSAGHARALVGAENAEELAREIAKRGLSVRQAEKFAQGQATGHRRQKPRGINGAGSARAPVAKDVDVLALEQKMTALLGLNVTIEGSGVEGRITIAYKTLDQLDDLLARLSSVPGK